MTTKVHSIGWAIRRFAELAVTAQLAGCASIGPGHGATRRSDSADARGSAASADAVVALQADFDACVGGACRDYVDAVRQHHVTLSQEASSAMDELGPVLRTLAADLDGAVSRVRVGRDEAGRRIQSATDAHVREAVAPAFRRFTTDVASETRLLEARLLTAAGSPVTLDVALADCPADVSPLLDTLRSTRSHLFALADAGAEWIPVVGDVYGVVKMVYDPRLEKVIYPKADAVAGSASDALRLRYLDPIGRAIPDADYLASTLRAAFSPSSALVTLSAATREESR